MPSLRRKRKYEQKRGKVSFKKLKKILPLFVLVLISFFYILLTTKHWNGNNRVSIAINGKEGGVNLITFNPSSNEIISLAIPADTQINLSRQLGVWKIGSVWRLGINEGLDGQLLAESITRHFKFPVYLWADTEALAFEQNNLPSLVKAIFKPYKSNLGLGDRLNIAIFTIRVKNTKRVSIDLSETAYLKKTTLADGEEGFIKAGSIPQNLAVIFSDPEISRKNYKIIIKDASGKAGLAEEVGEVIEVIGAKVASFVKQEVSDIDCEIIVAEQVQAESFSKFLNCDISQKLPEGCFDVELKIGRQFADRY